MKNRVRIGTCSGPAEAAFVRSVFEAHELPVLINGEMHASAMGGLGGFIQLDIIVDQADAEQATALLHDIRQGEHAVSEADELPEDDEAGEDRDERADADGVWQATHKAKQQEGGDVASADKTAAAAAHPKTTGIDNRRRRSAAVLFLSVVGFGVGHMSIGAWGPGIALLGLNVIGHFYAARVDSTMGGCILIGARLIDMLGALWRIWSRPDGTPAR